MKKLLIIFILGYINFSSGIEFKTRNNNFRNNEKTIKEKIAEEIEIRKEIEKDINKNTSSKNNNIKKIIILKKAKNLLGKKYVWGAKVGDYNNFDCSSFVKALYKEVGINLPRVSRDQSKIGQKISLNNLETGDLIFFHTLGNYVSHVGIYIGNNKFMHASSKAGKTIVSDFSGYYREKAVFGTRLGI
ncbi:C40 family peptidase [Pseudostreptobacillus hongkongensis]|uniref:C40 family peptidase n=1 Tax=Pseudostreptobacillus hongkongensis TaxID=1162717 RepID=UPI00083358E5|nr:C40 family peptidase [Pseudostreptobacillus hongkongensis]